MLPIKVGMPSLSPTMESGTIVQWHKKEGDEVAPGDLLCEVQTDKAVVGMETDEEGFMARIIKPEGSKNVVGDIIAIIASTDEDWKAVAADSASFIASQNKDLGTFAPPATPASAPSETQPIQSKPGKELPLGPAARILLMSYGLQSAQVHGTGPQGQVLKGDILAHVSNNNLQKVPKSLETDSFSADSASLHPTPLASYIDIPVSSMRATIAKRLIQSKVTIPHTYTRINVHMDDLFSLQKAANKISSTKISVNDLIVKACAYGLRLVPDMNAVSDPSGTVLQRVGNVDICIAVSTPSGLITPIVTSADTRPISSISETVKELAIKARDNKLQPSEFTGGSFTISNLGMFGIREFTAIINPPQVAILAVGGGRKSMSGVNTQSIVPVTDLTLTLSTDARFVDEVAAGIFLRHVKRYLECDPEALFADDPVLSSVAGSADLSIMAI